MSADDPDLYAILGVNPKASLAQIAHAYRRLIRAHHPDLHPRPDPAVLTAAAAAYAILRDPARRAAYDQSRRPITTSTPRHPHPHLAAAATEPDIRAGPVRWHRPS